MIHRLVALLLMVVCCGSLSSCRQQPVKDSLGRILVQSGAGSGAWSKDSRYLYYPYDGDMCRYDTQTGEKQTYKVEEVPEDNYDVSPDGTSIAFARSTDGVYVVSLDTGRKRRVYYPSHKTIRGFSWRPQGDILLCQDRVPSEYDEDTREWIPPEHYGVSDPEYCNVFLMSADGRKMENVRSVLHHPFFAADGSGFVYSDPEDHYHYFSLKTRKDKRLDFKEWAEYESIEFLYLSEEKLVYYTRITNPDGIGWTTKKEAVHLATMTIKPVDLPVTAMYMGISPDYTKLWVIEPGGSDWYNRSPSKLYIMDIPPEKPAPKPRPE